MRGEAAAAWVKVSGNDSYTVYASSVVVPKPGGVVEMWTLDDYKVFRRSSSGRPYLSKKMQGEYDCLKLQSRIVYATAHSEPMGGGSTTTYFTRPESWKPVAPGGFDDYVLKMACGARR